MYTARDAAKASGVAVAAGFDVLPFVVFVVEVQPAADKANSSNRETTGERTIISHLEELVLARPRQYSMRRLIFEFWSLVVETICGEVVSEPRAVATGSLSCPFS